MWLVRVIVVVICNIELEYLICYFILFNGVWIYDVVEKKDICFMLLCCLDVKNVIIMFVENEFKYYFFICDNMIFSLKDINDYMYYEF